MWDSIYAIQSEWIFDRLVRLPNCVIKADCRGSNGDSNMELLVVYSAMNARLKSSTLQKFSYINSTVYTSIYLLTIIHFFALCSDHTIFICLNKLEVFFAYSFTICQFNLVLSQICNSSFNWDMYIKFTIKYFLLFHASLDIIKRNAS